MAQAYSADDLPRLEAVARAAVRCWGLPAASEVSLVNLSENATYVIRPPDAEPVVLRVGRPDYSTVAEIRSELAWIEALRAAGTVRTAPVIRAPDGASLVEIAVPELAATRPCVLFGLVPGREPDEDGELAAPFRLLGALAARMHEHVRGWRLPPGFTRRRWDFATAIGATPHWGRWEDGIGVGSAERALLGRVSARVAERLGDYGTGPERFGLVHADMRLANILVDGDDVHVIDFDDAGFSWFLYDLAAALTFIEDRDDVPALVSSWLDGYRDVASPSVADLAIIPTMIMLRRLLVLAWIGSHAQTPLAQDEGLPYTAVTCELAERYLAGDGPGV